MKVVCDIINKYENKLNKQYFKSMHSLRLRLLPPPPAPFDDATDVLRRLQPVENWRLNASITPFSAIILYTEAYLKQSMTSFWLLHYCHWLVQWQSSLNSHSYAHCVVRSCKTRTPDRVSPLTCGESTKASVIHPHLPRGGSVPQTQWVSVNTTPVCWIWVGSNF